MTDGTGNLILEYMRRVERRHENMEIDMRGLIGRMSSVKEGLARINRRLDRLNERFLRIEKRLDLVEH